MKASKGYATGATVALTEDYVALFERFDLRNVICEVVDARRGNGVVAYTVAPVGVPAWDRSRVSVEVFGDDLTAVAS